MSAEQIAKGLTESLQKANAQAEHFEREWYLRGDEIDMLIAEITRLRFALDNIANESSDTWARDWATAALGDKQ